MFFLNSNGEEFGDGQRWRCFLMTLMESSSIVKSVRQAADFQCLVNSKRIDSNFWKGISRPAMIIIMILIVILVWSSPYSLKNLQCRYCGIKREPLSVLCPWLGSLWQTLSLETWESAIKLELSLICDLRPSQALLAESTWNWLFTIGNVLLKFTIYKQRPDLFNVLKNYSSGWTNASLYLQPSLIL